MALPKDYKGIVYQIIRPTGLLDPLIEVRPTRPEAYNQLKSSLIENVYNDIKRN